MSVDFQKVNAATKFQDQNAWNQVSYSHTNGRFRRSSVTPLAFKYFGWSLVKYIKGHCLLIKKGM
jgi:hypothetical protein